MSKEAFSEGLRQLSTELQVAERVPLEIDILGKKSIDIEKTLQRIESITVVAGQNPEQGEKETQLLLDEFSGQDKETQTWAKQVSEDRYEHYVPIPHALTIESLSKRKPLQEQNINTESDRRILDERYRYRFDNYGKVLQSVGFWERVGPELEKIPLEQGGTGGEQIDWSTVSFSPEQKHFSFLINGINGSARIDYEKAFTRIPGESGDEEFDEELQTEFDRIKRHKYHLGDDEIEQLKVTGISPLSVPDILTVLMMRRLNGGFSASQRQIVQEQQARILNDEVSNQERGDLYVALRETYDASLSNQALLQLLHATCEDLSLPEGDSSKVSTLEELKVKMNGNVDIIIPVASSDDGMNAGIARWLGDEFPPAFVMPVGGRSPHEVKTDSGKDNIISQYGEADDMISGLVRERYNHPYREPYIPEVEESHPIPTYRILSPDARSVDTQTNAAYMKPRLEALAELHERPLQVVCVTNELHSARFRAEIIDQIPHLDELVSDLVFYEYGQSPHTSDSFEQNIHRIEFMFNEHGKRAFGYATKKF